MINSKPPRFPQNVFFFVHKYGGLVAVLQLTSSFLGPNKYFPKSCLAGPGSITFYCNYFEHLSFWHLRHMCLLANCRVYFVFF